MDDGKVEELASGIRRADRASIARALNLLDDRRPAARQSAAQLLDLLLAEALSSHAHLVGMTGPPGVGKSSLTAALIDVWRSRGLSVGILAVDPSSPLSGGALLGDRLRMKANGDDDAVFVRSLSSRGQFGGLSDETWPMSLVLLSCFDIVLLETVGVGQREIDIAHSCDTTCFVAQPGSGDSIQFIKAGVLEMPHILVVNKADMGAIASRTRSELQATLGREHPDGDWQVPILSTSATDRSGIDTLADTLEEHRRNLLATQRLRPRRHAFQAHWLMKRLEEEFGRSGINELGGAQKLLEELSHTGGNPLTLYQRCVQRLQPATT